MCFFGFECQLNETTSCWSANYRLNNVCISTNNNTVFSKVRGTIHERWHFFFFFFLTLKSLETLFRKACLLLMDISAAKVVVRECLKGAKPQNIEFL